MASYVPKSMADLTRYVIDMQIEKTIELANEKLNDIVLECFKDHMNSDFYGMYKQSIYPRSYQMREKIGIKLQPIRSGNNVTFGVYFDSSKLESDYWSNKGYEGQRYNENGYTEETIMEAILNGEFDEDRDKDIIEEVKKDATMLAEIKDRLLNMFKENGFIVK